MPKERLDLNKVDFFELLASAANETKQGLVLDLLALARKGDSAAVRLLEKALIGSAANDESNGPIPILGGITQKKSNALQSNDGVIQNPKPA